MINKTCDSLGRFQVTLSAKQIVSWQGQGMRQIFLVILFLSDKIYLQKSNKIKYKFKNQKSIKITQKKSDMTIP